MVLAFDAAALALLAALLHRPFFTVLAVVCAVIAVLVVFGLQWHGRRLEDIRRSRHELRDEIRSLNDYLHRR